MVGDSLEESIGEKVADELVASGGEMNPVGLSQACFSPSVHRAETSHYLELIPHCSTTTAGDAIKGFTGE